MTSSKKKRDVCYKIVDVLGNSNVTFEEAEDALIQVYAACVRTRNMKDIEDRALKSGVSELEEVGA